MFENDTSKLWNCVEMFENVISKCGIVLNMFESIISKLWNWIKYVRKWCIKIVLNVFENVTSKLWNFIKYYINKSLKNSCPNQCSQAIECPNLPILWFVIDLWKHYYDQIFATTYYSPTKHFNISNELLCRNNHLIGATSVMR